MMRSIITIIVLAIFILSMPSISLAADATIEELEKRVTDLEKETSDIATKQEHTDKHISHLKEVVPKAIDGLSIAGGITMIIQGTQGNDDNDPPGEDVIDGSMSADLEIDTAIGKNGEAFLLMEMGAGDGLQDDEIVSFWGVNDDAGDNGSVVEVTEAWYEHRFIGDRLLFTVGKLNLSNYFDGNEIANDETEQFLATGFVNSLAIEFPDNTIGSRLTWDINELIALSFAWQDGNGDYEDIFEDSFYMVEADFRPKFGKLEGNYRGYYWINNTDHVELDNPANDDEPGWGAGVSIDQQVTGSITVFGRLGYQNREIYEFDTVWSAGAAMNGSKWGRDEDTVALAYGVANLSENYEDILDAAGVDAADEGHFEAYYSFAINENVVVSPDIQVVYNALGDDDYETVWIWGLRGQITF